jgi:uncharacterized protein (TIGR00369 family)
MDVQIVNANVSRVPFFRFLNFEVRSLDSLHAEAEMTFDDGHIGNPIMEYYHGGIIASFMEATAAIAVEPDFSDVPAKPINLTVDYLRPGVKGPLFARANVTRKGNRIASVSVQSWQAEREKAVAEGLYHFLLV